MLRRLVDIQGKLHESRAMHKAVGGVPTGGVPMGMPVHAAASSSSSQPTLAEMVEKLKRHCGVDGDKGEG